MDLIQKIILCVVLLTLRFSSENNDVHGHVIFTAVCPPFVYPQSDYIVRVFLSRNSETPVEYLANLICGRFIYEYAIKTVGTGKPLKLKIRVGLIEGTSCNLTISTKQGGNKLDEKIARVRIGRENFLLIHTDKSIYNPKDKVQFRIILLDRHGKQKTGRINIGVRDSRKNLVKLWRNVTSNNFGIFQDNFELSYEPNLGEWRIEASTSISSRKYVSFEVRETILSKVNVEVQVPDFGIIDEFYVTVPISVKAKYTYGEWVRGTCDVEVTLFIKECNGYIRRNSTSTSFRIDGITSQNLHVNPHIIAMAKNGSRLEFQVTVNEDLTAQKFVKKMSMLLFNYAYQIKAVEKLSYHRHGLPYIVDFHILNRKNELLKDPKDTVKIEHNFQPGVAPVAVPVKDGIVQCNFTETSTDGDQRFIKVTYKSFVLRYVVPERMMDYRIKSAIKEALVIELLPEKQTASTNQQIQLSVKSTTVLQSVNYLMVSYQEIVCVDTVQLASPSKYFPLDIPVSEDLSPYATLFVFTYVDNHYIGDFVDIQDCLKSTNNMNIILTNEKVEPGQTTSLTIQAYPVSMVILRAIDQSVLLLGGDSDLTRNTLEEEYRSGSYQSTNNTPFDLRRSGVVVITNAYETQDQIISFHADPLEDACNASTGHSDSAADAITSSDAVEYRSHSPETWLWTEVLMNSSNTSNKSFKAPNTLTSWVITGYSISPQFGIRFLSKSEKLTTSKQFIITLDLPYSVVQGEQLLLKILIHNYLPGSESRQVTVTINTNGFTVGKSSNGIGNEKRVNCNASAVCSVNFVLMPSKIGQQMLDIRAKTFDASDSLLKSLQVIPSGEKVVVTESKVFQNTNAASNGSIPRFNIHLPNDRVQDGDSIKVSFSSDILSSAIHHLENLFELPAGCGEQNIFLFVNNLVVLRYLNATNRLTPQVREKAIKFLELGYQRQLTFLTPSGSFSAFQTDAVGSTRLTAFVIRYFLLARHIISIDEEVITRGLEYLTTKFVKASAFIKFFEDGSVTGSQFVNRFDPDGVLLTAYCTFTFLNAKEQGFGNMTILQDIISKGRLHWILHNLSYTLVDSYAFIMSAYAEYAWNNVLGKSSLFEGNKYFPVVQRYSKTLGTELQYWNNISADPAVAVEMTSYVLLIYLYRNETQEALPLVKWLLQQRNANGGFYSTKDTIIGLSALAKYAEMTQKPGINLQVEVAHFENGNLVNQADKSVTITPTNQDLLYEIVFPPNTTHIEIKTVGIGTLYTQVSWTYHVNKPLPKKDFEILVTLIDDTPRTLGLRVCTNFTRENQSNMAIIEVNLPSGYTFDPETLNDLHNVTNFKRQELKQQNEKLNIYFEFIPKEPETCIYVEAMRSFKVGKAMPAIVKVYDYYETSRKAMMFYEVPEVTFCEICQNIRGCYQINCVD